MNATSGEPVSVAVVGAGLVGRRHAQALMAAGSGIRLHSIVDPAGPAREIAVDMGVPWFPTLSAMIAAGKPDGVILATPNDLHVDQGLTCVAEGIAALVEKPFSTNVASGERLVGAADAAGVTLLTGHHRRHNPLVGRAKAEIEAGAIGDIVSVGVLAWLYKPPDYFDVAWRREPGGGPVFINLIHDIDLLQFLCGRVRSVHAFDSSAVRANAVEDTAVIILAFESGALGTINVSDTIVAPWSWELTARDNPAYPATDELCYVIGGTHGSLELPGLRLWRNRNKRSWSEPVDMTRLVSGFDDPFILQVRQFAAVIRGREKPLVSGRDGLDALRVVEAVKRSAAEGHTVTVSVDKEVRQWSADTAAPSARDSG
jgi:predicted dehydrogenase